jgi:cation-transporting ATPase 13A2
MATGDNTLTAISVARQCNILDNDQEVYFGDIINQKLVWKSQVGGDDSINKSIDYLAQKPYENEEDDT